MKKLSYHSIPAFSVAALFAAGILIGKRVELWPKVMFVSAVALLVVAVGLLYFTPKNASLKPYLTIILAAMVLTVGVAKIRSDISSTPSFDIQSNKVVEVVGKIVEPPTRTDIRTRFTLKAESATDSSGLHTLPANILVTVVRRKKDTVEVSFPYGSRIVLKGQIGRPSSERNPGEFDARKYYEAQGISFVMRVRGYTNVSVLDSTSTSSLYELMMESVVIPVRSHTLLLIDRTIGGEEGELLKGIYIGERGGIPYATRSAFANSGISHILAVSGSNVVVVLAFCTMLFSLLRFPRTANMVATLGAVVFYMLLTGSQPPIARATVMTLVFQLGKLVGEKSNGLNSLGVSALLILGYDSRQLFDVGFQLSFAAVLSLIYLHPIARGWLPRMRENTWWRKLLAGSIELVIATFVATVGTLPMIAVYFGRVSMVGLFTNIVIVPTVGLSVVLGFISSLVGWFSFSTADAFAASNQVLLTLCLWVAKFSGGLSWAYIDTLHVKAIYALPFYAFLGIVFHLHMKNVARTFVVGFLASLNLLLLSPTAAVDKSVEGKMRVSFIDVGQGDAALIEFSDGKTMLIDAGPKSEDYDSGERIVAPFLKRRGISTIDYLVASHPHGDHIGGFPFVINQFDVEEVIESGQPAREPIYLEYARAVQNKKCRVRSVQAGDSSLTIGGAKLYVLYPTSTFLDADTTHPHQNLNNTSVAFKLCFGETSILFMGDAERDAEDEMRKLYGDFLHSTILKTGHHGSNTSSSQEFLDVVKPAYAIVSVGLNNKFNHPSEEVLRRLSAMKVETLRTDDEGAVMFESDGEYLQRIEWR